MGQPAAVIPEKIFFKIGEVCDLVGVQAHVLRYWETEFPMLSPQKNRSGQRTYRRRDVEIAFRIKELLYDELFTTAGAKKKLQGEMRETSRLKIVHSDPAQKETFIKPIQPISAPLPDVEDEVEATNFVETRNYREDIQETVVMDEERREAIKSLAAQLLELREMVKSNQIADEGFRLRKY
ncbi:MAG: MerR family transcriptional regulator [Pyrinomonadaceae bacterium]